jgi:hypothetical protein
VSERFSDSPRQAGLNEKAKWGRLLNREACLDAVAAILPEVHAIQT